MQLILITGYSGAGKSVTLKACEDFGFACMDNIPMPVISSVIDAIGHRIDRLAICSDIRSPDFNAGLFLRELNLLKAKYHCKLWFLTCETKILVARYNGTKHRHPLYAEKSILESLEKEQKLLNPLRMEADEVIDTTDYSPHALKHHLSHITHTASGNLAVQLLSFSYQKGLPPNADMIFDVRFLKNPHYEMSLRRRTGKESEVADFIERDLHVHPFLNHLKDMLFFLLPLYQLEGKSYLTLAFGCTGGRHRSVYVCETLYEVLKQHAPNVSIAVHHRELEVYAA